MKGFDFMKHIFTLNRDRLKPNDEEKKLIEELDRKIEEEKLRKIHSMYFIYPINDEQSIGYIYLTEEQAYSFNDFLSNDIYKMKLIKSNDEVISMNKESMDYNPLCHRLGVVSNIHSFCDKNGISKHVGEPVELLQDALVTLVIHNEFKRVGEEADDEQYIKVRVLYNGNVMIIGYLTTEQVYDLSQIDTCISIESNK